MKAEIISSGEELVLGATVDTNSAWLSVRLSQAGVPVTRHVAVGDALADIVGALREACGRAELVLLTGGLGPTEDDLARQALSELTGRPLVSDPAALEAIRERFARMGRPMPPENAVQALHPEGTAMIPNPNGTAPGIHAVVKRDGRAVDVFAMPGVPREMFAMYDAAVAPRLAGRGGGKVMLVKTINCFGAGESVIGEAIKPLMRRGRNPSVGTNVADAIIRVRITALGDTAESAAAMMEADRLEIRRCLEPLGDIVFGEDAQTLEGAVAEALARAGRTVAAAESCTGGLLAGRLTDIAGSSGYFLEGAVTYSNAAKVRVLGVPESLIAAKGAVSAEVAESMAAGIRARSGADIGLGITGIAGPGGATPEKPVGLVYIGYSDASGTVSFRNTFVGERDQVRSRAVRSALNLIRRRVRPA